MRVYDLTVPFDLHHEQLKTISRLASRFAADITFEFEQDDHLRVVDAKSLLGMMMRPIARGTGLTIRTKGRDEKEAIDFMVDWIQTGGCVGGQGAG